MEVNTSSLEELWAPASCREASLLFCIRVSTKASFLDPEGGKLERDIRDLGITILEQAMVSAVGLLEGELAEVEVTQIGRELPTASLAEYLS